MPGFVSLERLVIGSLDGACVQGGDRDREREKDPETIPGRRWVDRIGNASQMGICAGDRHIWNTPRLCYPVSRARTFQGVLSSIDVAAQSNRVVNQIFQGKRRAGVLEISQWGYESHAIVGSHKKR